jgi:hypothetical protein
MKDFFGSWNKSQTNSWNLNDKSRSYYKMNSFILSGFSALFLTILKNKKNGTFSEKNDFNCNKEKQFETKKFFS